VKAAAAAIARHGARLARRRRSRLAGDYRACERLPRELGERILDHLEPVRLAPARILELGAGTGALRGALERRYRAARVISAEDCQALLRQGRPSRWRLRRAALLCAAPDALPLAGASIDMLVCNLALHLADDAATALAEWHRVLRGGGVLTLATLGPLSFRELAETWAGLDGGVPHLHPYPDLHDLGDALLRAGFCDVVMDSQRLQVEFDDVHHLLRELRTIGGGNTLAQRARGLLTPRRLDALARAYPQSGSGGVHATVEAVFAHAWRPLGGGIPVAPPALVR